MSLSASAVWSMVVDAFQKKKIERWADQKRPGKIVISKVSTVMSDTLLHSKLKSCLVGIIRRVPGWISHGLLRYQVRVLVPLPVPRR